MSTIAFRTLLTAVSATTLLAPSVTASAQPAARVSSEAFYSGGNSPACGAGMSLMTSVDYRAASVALLPAPVTSLSRPGLGAPVAVAMLSTPDRHALQLQASGAVGRAEAACASFSAYDRAWAALSYRFGNNGVMLSHGHRGLSTLDPSQSRQGVTVGVWRNMKRVRVSFDVRRDAEARDGWNRFTVTRPSGTFTNSDTLIVPFTPDTGSRNITEADSTPVRMQWPTTSLRTRMQLSLGRLALDFTFGGTMGSAVANPSAPSLDTGGLATSTTRPRNDVRLWGRADARVALTPFMEAVGGLASLPPQELGMSPARRVAVLGFAINGIPRISRAPGSSKGAVSDARSNRESFESFQSVRDEAGTVRLRVRVPKATNVELSSELTGWAAVPMQKSTGGWWELPVNSPAGVYRVNIRVDGGAWTAPPNVSTMRDEFGGQVGIVKIG